MIFYQHGGPLLCPYLWLLCQSQFLSPTCSDNLMLINQIHCAQILQLLYYYSSSSGTIRQDLLSLYLTSPGLCHILVCSSLSAFLHNLDAIHHHLSFLCIHRSSDSYHFSHGAMPQPWLPHQLPGECQPGGYLLKIPMILPMYPASLSFLVE